jgi:hypothetical protein
MKRILKMMLLITGLGLLSLYFLLKHWPAFGPRNASAAAEGIGDHDFVFIDGKPWIAASIGGKRQLVLFDTGASLPFINSEWATSSGFTPTGKAQVGSAVGSYELARGKLKEIAFSNQTFSNEDIALSQQRTSSVGASVIFRPSQVLISKKGYFYGQDYRLTRSLVACLPLKFDLSGNTFDSPVSRIYLGLTIDGKQEFALLDTGRAEFLTGVGFSPSGGVAIPRLALLENNGKFNFRSYYPQESELKFGNDTIKEHYLVFPGISNIRAKYVIGSAILDRYSIYLDYRHGVACLLKP